MIKRSYFILCLLFIACYTSAYAALNSLTSNSFPKTFFDSSFVERQRNKANDFEGFAHLTAYQRMILDEVDKNIAEQIACDIAEQEQLEQQQQQQNQEQQNQEQQNQEQQQQSSSSPASPSSVTTMSQNPSASDAAEGYCSIRHPGIPEGQKIPFGSPVLHEDFIFCSLYGDVNRGEGCRPHAGYDIGCRSVMFDKPVFTPADGVVSLVLPNRAGYSAGNYILIDHGNGFQSWYLHLNKMFVKKGDVVKAGCQIATVGHTGGSVDQAYPHMGVDMSHLHYEIHYSGNLKSVSTESDKRVAITFGWPHAERWNNTAIDPTQFICVYANYPHGYCGATYPYKICHN